MKSFFENHPLVQAHNDEMETIKAKNYLHAVFGHQAEPLINELNGMPLPFWEFAERAARQEFGQEWIMKRVLDIKAAPEHEHLYMIDVSMLVLNYELNERIKRIAAYFEAPAHIRGVIGLSQSTSAAIKAFGESFARGASKWVMSVEAFRSTKLLQKHKRRKSPIERIKNKKPPRKP
jgi:hypothetical protein